MEASLITSDRQIKPERKFEFNLEGLRGFAALTVVLGHAISHGNSIDPSYTPSKIWIGLFPGHASVLLFFILSGYVIGITNKKYLHKADISPYIKKRLVRLYPIYLICILITLISANNILAPKIIIGHLFFLQNSIVPLLYENNPLWSLNNEVLYYLLFIPLSLFRINTFVALILSIFLGLLFNTFIPNSLLSSYSLGFAFWLSGLWLAQNAYPKNNFISSTALVALLLLFNGYTILNPLTTTIAIIVDKLHIKFPEFNGPIVNLADITILPLCLYVFSNFINYKLAYNKALIVASTLLALFYSYHIAAKYGISSSYFQQIILPILSLLSGFILWYIYNNAIVNMTNSLLPNWIIKVGSISYALYVLHFPIGLIIAKIPFFTGNCVTFLVRLLIDLAITIYLAFLLEKKFQPRVRDIFYSRP